MIAGAFESEGDVVWTVSVRISDADLEARVLAQLDAIPEVEIEDGDAMLTVTDRIDALAPESASIVLATPQQAASALQAGAAAVLSPDIGRAALRAAFRAVMNGLAVLDRRAAGAAFADPLPGARPERPPQALRLTSRELEVLAALAEGASNKEIARRLGISPRTAKFHVASIVEKLDATGRTDAVTHAVRLGLVML